MKEIRLTKGYVAMVDDEDFEKLSRYKWWALPAKDRAYAGRTIYLGNGKTHSVFMHREIMGAVGKEEVDHRDGDGLNNQRNNLRICTHAENLWNQKLSRSNKSGFKGVSWNKEMHKWTVILRVNGKQVYLGLFEDVIEAALAYDEAAQKYYGEFARTNFTWL